MIETRRLKLRKIATGDGDLILKLFNSPGWLEFIGDRNVNTLDEAETYIVEKLISHYNKQGFGTYVIISNETGEKIGSCGLYQRDDLQFPDIGFALLPNFYRKGYTFEAAKAVLSYGKNHLKLQTILGFTDKQNVASIRLLKKLGLRESGTYLFKDELEELLLFST